MIPPSGWETWAPRKGFLQGLTLFGAAEGGMGEDVVGWAGVNRVLRSVLSSQCLDEAAVSEASPHPHDGGHAANACAGWAEHVRAQSPEEILTWHRSGSHQTPCSASRPKKGQKEYQPNCYQYTVKFT